MSSVELCESLADIDEAMKARDAVLLQAWIEGHKAINALVEELEKSADRLREIFAERSDENVV